MTTLYIEAIENEQEQSYEIPVKIWDGRKTRMINLKFDNGASYTVIAASVLLQHLTDDGAKQLDQYLSRRAATDHGKDVAPFQKKFRSATGDAMTGYLVDSGKIKFGSAELSHFYYYLVPRNKRPVVLLGNDFLRYCEYTHAIGGNILITKMDEDAYAKHYANAMSVDELAAVIDEIGKDNADGFGSLL